ncbi:MAG: glycoside hydrolase family 3 C-terminal domain-containing protein [Actinomycetaceae bacterium]|nr:glycoside hydrolase family 3 C-terminal domain-containing protein [Actinomycetaceae bacterium]
MRPAMIRHRVAVGVAACALAAPLAIGIAPQASALPDPRETPTDPAAPGDTPAISSEETAEPVPTNMPWLNPSLPPEKRAELLVDAMTEGQLLHMVHGQSDLLGTRVSHADGPPSIGYIPPIPELRVPALILSDGPSGLRNKEKATQLPAPITQAASFDPEVARAYGQAIGEDAKDRGQDLIFSPGFNLARNPQAGRTFEYFGEDPLLAGTIAAAHVNGLQSTGIMATLKHFVANNQEQNRTLNSSNVDERTLHEIYEEPFRIAVRDSQPAVVMCAYNRVNHTPACGNPDTLKRDLREWMGFKGFVVTDYPAAWSPTDLKNGLNVELPWQFWTKPKRIREAIAKGEMTWDDIRDRVRETLIQMFRFGLFDHPWDDAQGDRVRPIRPIDPARGNAVAQASVEKGAVLLKNDGMLPLTAPKPGEHRRVLVVGDAAKNTLSGGGSSNGSALISDTIFDALKARYGADTEVVFSSQLNPARIAIQAKKADEVIVVAGVLSTELLDRLTLDVPVAQRNAISIAARNNDHVAVVMQTGGPVVMPWLDDVEAVLNVWYPGQAAGAATARLLFGDVNPSGRLPQTFPADAKEVPASTRNQFPGAHMGFEANYTEGVMMGYRWWGSEAKKPLFPFGHGLSYTTFDYGTPTVEGPGTRAGSVRVSFDVTNTGRREGATVPQVYVSKPASAAVPTPPRELAGFTKISLAPGETRRVSIDIPADRLAVWSETERDRVVTPGHYAFAVADNAEAPAATIGYDIR